MGDEYQKRLLEIHKPFITRYGVDLKSCYVEKYSGANNDNSGVAVLGLGGCGVNIVAKCSSEIINDTWIMDTALSPLHIKYSDGYKKGNLLIGKNAANMCGCGGATAKARRIACLALEESRSEIESIIKAYKKIILVGGIGGRRFGCEAILYISKLAKEHYIDTEIIAVLPLEWEENQYKKHATVPEDVNPKHVLECVNPKTVFVDPNILCDKNLPVIKEISYTDDYTVSLIKQLIKSD